MYSHYLKKLSITFFFLISFLIGCSALPSNVAGTFTQTFKAVGALVYGYEDDLSDIERDRRACEEEQK